MRGSLRLHAAMLKAIPPLAPSPTKPRSLSHLRLTFGPTAGTTGMAQLGTWAMVLSTTRSTSAPGCPLHLSPAVSMQFSIKRLVGGMAVARSYSNVKENRVQKLSMSFSRWRGALCGTFLSSLMLTVYVKRRRVRCTRRRKGDYYAMRGGHVYNACIYSCYIDLDYRVVSFAM